MSEYRSLHLCGFRGALGTQRLKALSPHCNTGIVTEINSWGEGEDIRQPRKDGILRGHVTLVKTH